MHTHRTDVNELINGYISLEKEIQKLIHQVTHPSCSICNGKCCKEEICKESLESNFLAILTKQQGIQFDSRSGWLGASGCRLAFGRPLVCYDFFCEDVLKSTLFKASGIQAIIDEFMAVGKNAYGSKHLICVENLDRLSPRKIDKMVHTIHSVLKRAATV